MSRGIRNNNPGNIKDFGIDWNGMVDPGEEKTFCVFESPWYGIRAMARLFGNYQKFHLLKSVFDIINRWAPPSDNNPTNKYATFVALKMKVGLYESIDLKDFAIMKALVDAVVRFENGKNPYTWETYLGIQLAGIEPIPGDYT